MRHCLESMRNEESVYASQVRDRLEKQLQRRANGRDELRQEWCLEKTSCRPVKCMFIVRPTTATSNSQIAR